MDTNDKMFYKQIFYFSFIKGIVALAILLILLHHDYSDYTNM